VSTNIEKLKKRIKVCHARVRATAEARCGRAVPDPVWYAVRVGFAREHLFSFCFLSVAKKTNGDGPETTAGLSYEPAVLVKTRLSV
jgi:hypothetical protein